MGKTRSQGKAFVMKNQSGKFGVKSIVVAALVSTMVVFSMLPAISQAQVEVQDNVGKTVAPITKSDESTDTSVKVGKGSIALSKSAQDFSVVAMAGKGKITLKKI